MADPEDFRLLTQPEQIETIARRRGIRILQFLKDSHGGQNWIKKKGIARIDDLRVYIGRAEVNWFEAHGVGRTLWKIKIKLD